MYCFNDHCSDDDRYTVVKEELAANLGTGDFQSVNSTLIFNIISWRSGGRLDRVMDNANYPCQSTGNIVGREGVHSTTYFRVECELDSNRTVPTDGFTLK